jgi:hypothetical protein
MPFNFINFISTQLGDSVTTQQKATMLENFTDSFSYSETIDGEDNPQTRAEYANYKIHNWIKTRISGEKEKKQRLAAVTDTSTILDDV